MAKLGDQSAEKLILSTLAQSGLNALGEVDDIITASSFTCEDNQLIYDVLKTSIDAYGSINLKTFLSTSKDLGYNTFLTDKEQIHNLFSGENDVTNIRKLAKKIKKIEIAIHLQKNLKDALNQYKNITGNESVNDIFGIAEKAIDEVDASLSHENNDRPINLFEGLTELLEHLEENPVDQVGISTGFASLDSMIGGGLRAGYINLCVARPKSGKSTLAIAIARNIGKNGIPVLYLDTEMDKQTTALRRLAAEAGIDYEFIETGKFKNHPKRSILYQIASELEDNDCVNYQRIAGKKFDEVLNIIKRWVKKDVGFDENGNTKPCVIIYDYFKLMQASEIDDMQEYQALGYQLSKLTDFLGNAGVSCLGFVQANREGISKESTDIVSQSDRLLWFCASLFLLRKKTNEEILEEGSQFGNRKMVPLDGMRFAKDCEGWLNFNCQNFNFEECGIGIAPEIQTE